MESTTPAAPATDANAASMDVAPPAGPADAKPPAPTLDVSDAPQPTEAKPPPLEISPRAWAERERDKEHDLDEVPSEITAETVLACLRRCEVQENEDRKNVRTDEDVAVRSITLGALSRSHAPARPSGWTRRQPRLARLLAEFGDKILPEGFPFASIQLNYAYASAMHTDKSNDGPSAIIALGEFTGGELWTADRGVLPCRNELRLFNGNQPHCTLPFKGERYSLIYFSSSGHDRMAPKDVQQCEALGFCRLPTAPLSHVYRPAEFATPHKEFEYTFGYHVTTEERCAYAVSSLNAWREDWAPHEMREACKARAKPGETLGPDSICPGLKLGYARLRSAVLRGRDRDGYGESQSAECPKGLRGAIVGVVMSHERTRGQVIKDGKTYEHLDIFQVFYLNGQSEELELDEIASSLEPRQDMSDAPDGLSAPELARRALRARGHDVGGPRYEAPRFIPRAGDVAERVARNARLHHAVNVLRQGSPDVAPACYEYVQRGGVYEVDDLVNGARLVTRIPEGAQGEDGLENLEVLAAAAGAVSKGRLSPVIPPDLRRRILFLALDVKLRLLGFDDFAFSPSLNDLCLDHETMNDKFEECDSAPPSRAAVKRIVLDLVARSVPSLPPFEKGNFREHCLEELRRELPIDSWSAREGDVVWVSRRDWVDSRRLAQAPDDPTSSLLVERSNTVAIGQKCRRRWLEYGTMYGVVEEGSGPLPDGGFAKYRVRWDGRIDDWYAKKQCLEYVISDGPICREDLVPAVVVPASSAHFEGGELLLYAMARKGCTIWHRTGKARSFDLAGAALRLLALCDGNGYILARDARLVDYDSEDAPACDVNDAAHANAAAIHTRRQLALRSTMPEVERKPSRADRLKRRAALPRHDGPVSFDDRGSDGETKKRKRPRPSPQTRDAALLIERAAPIAVRQENPKKGKSAERYELYKRATTAREYVALGGTKADLKYDIQRGWVTVLAPPVVAEAPAPAAEAGGSPGSSASSDSAPRSTDPVAYLPETPVWPSPAKEPLSNAAPPPPA